MIAREDLNQIDDHCCREGLDLYQVQKLFKKLLAERDAYRTAYAVHLSIKDHPFNDMSTIFGIVDEEAQKILKQKP